MLLPSHKLACFAVRTIARIPRPPQGRTRSTSAARSVFGTRPEMRSRHRDSFWSAAPACQRAPRRFGPSTCARKSGFPLLTHTRPPRPTQGVAPFGARRAYRTLSASVKGDSGGVFCQSATPENLPSAARSMADENHTTSRIKCQADQLKKFSDRSRNSILPRIVLAFAWGGAAPQ
jgi:hypothetical protein